MIAASRARAISRCTRGEVSSAASAGIGHVAALDQDLRHGGQVQPGKVVAEHIAVVPVVVAGAERGIGAGKPGARTGRTAAMTR